MPPYPHQKPFIRSISLYLDWLTLRLEALPTAPRREALRRARWQTERRYVACTKAGTR